MTKIIFGEKSVTLYWFNIAFVLMLFIGLGFNQFTSNKTCVKRSRKECTSLLPVQSEKDLNVPLVILEFKFILVIILLVQIYTFLLSLSKMNIQFYVALTFDEIDAT